MIDPSKFVYVNLTRLLAPKRYPNTPDIIVLINPNQ